MLFILGSPLLEQDSMFDDEFSNGPASCDLQQKAFDIRLMKDFPSLDCFVLVVYSNVHIDPAPSRGCMCNSYLPRATNMEYNNMQAAAVNRQSRLRTLPILRGHVGASSDSVVCIEKSSSPASNTCIPLVST
eukprot:811212_1